MKECYPITVNFGNLVIARRPKADVAISYPSEAEAVPASNRLTWLSHPFGDDAHSFDCYGLLRRMTQRTRITSPQDKRRR